jgi:hypothetical protein
MWRRPDEREFVLAFLREAADPASGLGVGMRARAEAILDVAKGPEPTTVLRITWWSNGTRAKEVDEVLPARGEAVTLQLHDRDRVTVERRS